MTDNKIDQQLERFSTAVAHASPDPLPLEEPSHQHRLRRPVFALTSAFIVVMLTLGLGALAVTWTRSLDSNQQPSPVDVASEGHTGYDPGALMRPDLMVLRPAVVEPGNTVSVFFPDERTRGIHFVLESVANNGEGRVEYYVEFHLISDWGDGHEPHGYSIEEMSDIAIADVGVGGPGPDLVIIPAEALPGEYRICTANSNPNICTPLAIEIYE